ncbi:hypothetical protein OS175_04190 [Marinicella sp. S1101]|uniref:hypothetical protein n=1 Tax=Marinicella marina TaxID=2996016 RepID=UPI002260D34D|nr:hypothetical protein [Marinicella marina]MCX7553067.1 hypothetical protein [Marinicella marina]
MKYFLKYITIDPLVEDQYPLIRSVQGWRSWKPKKADLPLVKGPGNPRIQIIDLSELAPYDPVPGLNPVVHEGLGRVSFRVKSRGKYDYEKLRQLSVFSIALKVLHMYEGSDALGRRVEWSFGDLPLKIIIRHSKLENAQYFRKKREIRLCYFDSDNGRIYTSASPDIVAHEVAHAILDGIAPDLLDCPHYDSYAIHEAVADLTALFLSFEMDHYTDYLLDKYDGNLSKAREFGWIAEQFGAEMTDGVNDHYLRSLNNEYSFRNDWGARANESDHYEISQVLSGAIFNALILEYERESSHPEKQEQSKGLSLFIAGNKIRRMLFRGLDYMPPGEVNLFDLAYSIICADKVSFPEDEDANIRQYMLQEFIKRGVGYSNSDFEFDTNTDIQVDMIDLDLLVSDFKYLEEFIRRYKSELLIPHDEYKIKTPILNNKFRYLKNGVREKLQEIIVKVSWYEELLLEESIDDADRIFVKFGTTLVIDKIKSEVLSIQSTNRIALKDFEKNNQVINKSQFNLVKQLVEQDSTAKVQEFNSTKKNQCEYMIKDRVLLFKRNGFGLHK